MSGGPVALSLPGHEGETPAPLLTAQFFMVLSLRLATSHGEPTPSPSRPKASRTSRSASRLDAGLRFTPAHLPITEVAKTALKVQAQGTGYGQQARS